MSWDNWSAQNSRAEIVGVLAMQARNARGGVQSEWVPATYDPEDDHSRLAFILGRPYVPHPSEEDFALAEQQAIELGWVQEVYHEWAKTRMVKAIEIAWTKPPVCTRCFGGTDEVKGHHRAHDENGNGFIYTPCDHCNGTGNEGGQTDGEIRAAAIEAEDVEEQ